MVGEDQQLYPKHSLCETLACTGHLKCATPSQIFVMAGSQVLIMTEEQTCLAKLHLSVLSSSDYLSQNTSKLATNITGFPF